MSIFARVAGPCLLARLNLHLSILLRVLQLHVDESIALIQKDVISSGGSAEISESNGSWLHSLCFDLDGLHDIIGVLWTLMFNWLRNCTISHALPVQCSTGLVILHDVLFVSVVEKWLISLWEETLTTFVTFKFRLDNLPNVGKVLRWFLYRFKAWIVQAGVCVDLFSLILLVEDSSLVLLLIECAIDLIWMNMVVCSVGVLDQVIVF